MITALILFMVGCIADAATTYAALRLPGLIERNALARWVMARIGILGWCLARVSLAVAGAWCLWTWLPGDPLATGVAWAMALQIWGIAANNLRIIRG